jgi:hypothetical protein
MHVMKASWKLRALVAGTLAVAGAPAFADMSLDPSAGSIFVNLWDQTNNTSYIFDTGLNESTFTGSNTVNDNLASDPNYQAFVAGVAGGNLTTTTDTVTYNVVAMGTNTALTTGSGPPGGSVFNSKLLGGLSAGTNVVNGANTVTSSTTNSAYANAVSNPTGTAIWGSSDATWNNDLRLSSDGALGTALNFFSLTFGTGSHSSNTIKSTLLTFPDTWDLTAGGLLTYNVSAVPIPAPLGLRLGGLGLLAIVARRNKSGEQGISGAAA